MELQNLQPNRERIRGKSDMSPKGVNDSFKGTGVPLSDDDDEMLESHQPKPGDCGSSIDIVEPHTDLEDRKKVSESVKSKLPNGTIVIDLDEKESVFLIQVTKGYCVTTQCHGLGTCYFGGHSYMLLEAIHAERLIVHPDPTSTVTTAKENIVAIVVSQNTTLDDNLNRHDRILSVVVTQESVKHLLLPSVKL